LATVDQSTWGKFPEELNLRQHTLETQFHSGCDMFMYHAYFLV